MGHHAHDSVLDLPPSATRDHLLLVLLTDTPVPKVQEKYGNYHHIFTELFKESLAYAPSSQKPDHETGGGGKYKLTIESYDVVEHQHPTLERIKEADGVLLTGSSEDAHDDSVPWVLSLIEYITSLQPLVFPALKTTKPLRLVGICFGHQLIARAFGGRCEVNPKGWEIGVRRINLTQTGKDVFRHLEDDELSLHQIHSDHVPELPTRGEWESVGSTPRCDIHGMVGYAPGDRKREDIRILTLQGHPELGSKIINLMIDAKEENGTIDAELAAESRKRADEPDEDVAIGRIVLEILGVDGA